MVEEVEVVDLASFLTAVRDRLSGFGSTLYWYRGHAAASWTLVPAVHRHYDSEGERGLITRFMLSAPTRHERCPDLTDAAGWLCLMQHYGAPTRLLDWTMSPLTALYFALAHEREITGPAAVWVLHAETLNGLAFGDPGVFSLNGPQAEVLLLAAFRPHAPVEHALAVLSGDVDTRMAVQQAAFTIHGNPQPLEKDPRVRKYLLKLVIPEAARETLRRELWFLGVRRSTLFPDLANLAFDLANDEFLVPRRR